MGGPPSGEGPDRCGTPVRVLVAMAGVSLRLSLSPWLLALQLLQFKVDRAQTPLTGDVLPPPHHARAPQAAGRVLQVGEPPMDGVRHEGPPSPLSGPHGGIGNCTEKPTHGCSNKSTRVGLALSRTAVCSPSAHHQMASGGRRLAALFHEGDHARLYPVVGCL